MFDIGFSELLVIGVVALVVIGPERLPKVARTVGLLLGRAQRYVSDVKSEIHREIELDELKKLKADMEEASQRIQGELQTSFKDIEVAVQGPEPSVLVSYAEPDPVPTPTPVPESDVLPPPKAGASESSNLKNHQSI
jgi:sec-independent protein translocase protein TatB